MRKLPYSEGTWFAVPLKPFGFSAGVVARMKRNGKIILGYFFGPRYASVPTLSLIDSLRPQNAIARMIVGNLGLRKGEWPIIGRSESWNRSEWPMPIFIRRDILRPMAWLVYLSDDDPSVRMAEEQVHPQTTGFDDDGLYGAGAAEIELSMKLLAPI
jgi:hypothetical protein